MDSTLNKWNEQMEDFYLPRWSALPDMELYMDQVISQIDKYLMPLQSSSDEHFVTASMVNNYVKQQLLPAPIKKRYGRTHMAHLVLICLLKQILSIPEVKKLLQAQLTCLSPEELPQSYDSFCCALENSFKNIVQITNTSSVSEQSNSVAIDAVVLACAGKFLSQKIINSIQNDNE